MKIKPVRRNFKVANNLRMLKISRCGIHMSFLRDLADNTANLSKIKILNLHSNAIITHVRVERRRGRRRNNNNNGNGIRMIKMNDNNSIQDKSEREELKEILPKIGEKLKSLRTFVCTGNNTADIAPYLLSNIHGELLKQLYIEVDARSIEKILDSHINSGNEIKCDFENLIGARITFANNNNDINDGDSDQEEKDRDNNPEDDNEEEENVDEIGRGKRILKWILRRICQPFIGMQDFHSLDSRNYKLTSNLKCLKISNLGVLKGLSPLELFTMLNEIEFTRLGHLELQYMRYQTVGNYGIVTLKQLVDTMSFMSNKMDKKIQNTIKNMHFRVNMTKNRKQWKQGFKYGKEFEYDKEKSEKNNSKQSKSVQMDIIANGLRDVFIENKMNITIEFEDSNPSKNLTNVDIEFGPQFAKVFLEKIIALNQDMIDVEDDKNKFNIKSFLNKHKFNMQYSVNYNGVDHFYTRFSLCQDRVTMCLHLKTSKMFKFVVHIKSSASNKSSSTIEQCRCKIGGLPAPSMKVAGVPYW